MPLEPTALRRDRAIRTAAADPRRPRLPTTTATSTIPPMRDILIRGSRIVSVTAPDEDTARKQEIARRAADADEAQVIDARGKLVMPGFVNAHYHSYDVLAKGLLEDMPFDVWALHSQPAYFGRRSKAEIRIRTLLGALECLRTASPQFRT